MYFVIGFVLVLSVIIRIAVGKTNHERIREYLGVRKCEVIKIKWSPFGVGWIGERDSVIYEVTFRTSAGLVKTQMCKTGVLSGVYFCDVEPDWLSPVDVREKYLEEENARLKDEIQRLKSEK